ncbi:acetyl-CoA carboxylase biotin carboxyl carrier protein [Mucilaginibacter robiniae]|uniref:Biotin carboxyl carrier protein of acetyl-CoA carboxylase n=1 Tax=Mucilaginibacter robiniae TaxID=2728022 RepID=A0A7L5E010_9SPHI|nr:acetyl-CoA carboxylase biotin carboxyl carrier protein [Mucilaginibacter robiniae]QJD96575.1 acetyl-CoA carboxylase biotin carboxyl carrier protein [Mucilaginibacter robiniae]
MDIKQIQDLIRFVSKSGVNEVSIEQNDFKITIKTNQAPTIVNATIPGQQPISAAAPVSTPVAVAHTPAPAEAPAAADVSKYVTIKSPMIGTFYRSSSPEKPSFANIGDEIQAGSVLCIIEAMKLFNEIESEVSGRIVKILVDNSSPVEYDQPLFLVEPM